VQATTECLCRVTITDIKGGGHVVEVKASSLYEAVAKAIKLKKSYVATHGFRPVKVLIYEPMKESFNTDGESAGVGQASRGSSVMYVCCLIIIKGSQNPRSGLLHLLSIEASKSSSAEHFTIQFS
jgi:hypothetical protein